MRLERKLCGMIICLGKEHDGRLDNLIERRPVGVGSCHSCGFSNGSSELSSQAFFSVMIDTREESRLCFLNQHTGVVEPALIFGMVLWSCFLSVAILYAKGCKVPKNLILSETYF